ncbi:MULTISPECIES: DUF5455 family protein [Citrobacter]|uniref:DUF5455 family protein n=1 Tax=Citrobacter TaxID=544 RepID=UPI000A0F7507|nr:MULTISPECIES: DUF5455 family protein [Citrobacter]NBD84572.1 phage coat protein [Citrobacter werkmanii]ORT76777.1 phage coat protein [Citrobacter werkmanii]OSP18937.1 phage coat protein [Citrobacter werkmanii]UQX61564.1 DUF5455 family protein [Citrobacter sp. XT1-2-2]HCT9709923.1 DUF5455 family protein [Citrobacter werkmanii]
MPVLLGIPALISFIGTVLTSLLTSLFSVMARRFYRAAFAITAFLGLLVGVNALLLGLLDGLSAQLPVEVADAISYIMPSNTLPCIYAIFSAKAAVFIFDAKNKILSYLSWGN